MPTLTDWRRTAAAPGLTAFAGCAVTVQEELQLGNPDGPT